MNTNRSDLEIVYNLQWKNASSYEKSNIVGMYDIPATTLNWESFKSYLLKNSGATTGDIKVSYVSMNDKEFPIESQLDFQIAMYSFRQRARNGDIITLMLEKDYSLPGNSQRRKRSFENQKHEYEPTNSFDNTSISEPAEQTNPPAWFSKYMEGFKKEIIEDITSSVINHVSKGDNIAHFPFNYKKVSKLGINNPIIIDKELTKALKLERKLDNKLEKLEQKSKKIKEKKLALVDYNENDGPMRTNLPTQQFSSFMGAVSLLDPITLHMSGGETYLHQWNIMNTGRITWTSETTLCYAWGSEALKPMETIVHLPLLEPGQKGNVTVKFMIPTKPGNYESYWHFYHLKERFGDWLGCSIIVDPLPPKASTSFEGGLLKTVERDDCESTGGRSSSKTIHDIDNVIESLEELRTDEELANVCMDNNSISDNQSIVSIADSNSIHSTPSDEFVLITKTDCVEFGHKSNIKVEKAENLDQNENRDNILNNDSNDTVIECEECNQDINSQACTTSSIDESGYAYVHVNGQKHAVPKYLLRDDYLATAEDAPAPSESIEILEDYASRGAESLNNGCSSDGSELIQNTKVTQSIAVSTECLATTSYKESIHSDANDLSKENNLQDFEMDQSLNLNESQMQDSTASFATIDEPQMQTLNLGPAVAENACYEYSRRCPTHCLPLLAYRNKSILPPYKSENLTIDIPQTANEAHSSLHDRFGFYMKHPHPFNHSKYCAGMHCQQPFNPHAPTYLQTTNPVVYPTVILEPHCMTSATVAPTIMRSAADVPLRSAPMYPVRFESHNNEAVSAAINDRPKGVHRLPSTLVSGASLAMNTVRSMFGSTEQQENRQQPSNTVESTRDRNLSYLREMGFVNQPRNVNLLDYFEDDLERVIGALVL